MIRFVHTADLQLGRPFSSLPDKVRSRLQDRRFDTLEKVLELAREREAHFVVVAGDFFDDNTVDRDLVADACTIIARVGVPVYILPGNHDHGGPESVYRGPHFERHAHEYTRVLLSKEPVVVADGAAVLLPAPLLQRHVAGDTTDHLTAETGRDLAPDAIRIGVAHGSTTDFGDESEASNVLDLDVVNRAQLDYLALGDWHGLKQVGERAWYSGTPEPDRFKDNDPGRALVVEIDGPGAVPKVEAVSVGHFEWLRWEATFHDLEDVQAFAKKVHALERADRTLVRLEYEGSVPLDVHAALEEALDDARARLMELRERGPGVLIMPSEAELENLRLQGFVKAAVDELRAASADENDTEAAKALELFYKLHTSITSQA